MEQNFFARAFDDDGDDARSVIKVHEVALACNFTSAKKKCYAFANENGKV